MTLLLLELVVTLSGRKQRRIWLKLRNLRVALLERKEGRT